MMPARKNSLFAHLTLRVPGLAAGLCVAAGVHAQQAPAPLPVPSGAQPVVLAAPSHAASAAAARAGDTLDAADRRDPSEPNVKRTVIEDEGSKVEELRVRGQTQRIVVTPKVGTKKSYEIITDSAGREMYDGSGASRGAVGKRVWNVFNF